MEKVISKKTKIFILTLIFTLCILSSATIYAAFENYESSIDIASNSYLIGAKRSYSDDTFMLELSDVEYANVDYSHRADIIVTDGNSVIFGYDTVCEDNIALYEDCTTTYTIGTGTSGKRCYAVSTENGQFSYDGFTADSVMWSE